MPTDWARGPWDRRFLHGGPPAALLAHGLERERRDDAALLITRLTVDLMRPVPQAPLTLNSHTVRSGRRIRLAQAELLAGDTPVARATGLMLHRDDAGFDPDSPSAEQASPIAHWGRLAPKQPEAFGDGTPLFHRATEFRPVPRTPERPTFAIWIRIPYALLPDVPLSRLEYVAAISDYVNAVGGMANPERSGFINADISLYLHRDAAGEWICLESVARVDRAGVAVSNVHLHDASGLLGSVSAACLRQPSKPESE